MKLLVGLKRCPSCKQILPGHRGRTCAKCKMPIDSHHKWFFNEDGRIEHRTCKHPHYYSDDQWRKITRQK